ncbi:conserved hypothetical protein [Leishmania infantum JPCM5]|uniref:Uncharacterized protein n=2 Tax=Leishmania infantum TaxID=5671 RepID=A4I2C9_LEIIN|nr:conserved hypothetical protein [Leishmania infantum JPCM5]CAC9497361.1 hypothetical_protein_-_conserved [Leishmania infantum]CAM68918.1 conserved hypothetical protein [Leishmania infantum JPCM5]SUZ42794.1 hypothetical_protein_-_conserved [Leishmania infantum]|eukprot:XP_001470540.1 conserved hypothetical protein [Leishmania infantum JPCM5]
MTDLSNRQWRALAQAYPFYLAGEVGVGGPANDGSPDRQAGVTESELVAPSLSSSEEFVQYVVPRVAKVFPEELQAYERANDCGGQPAHPNGGRACRASPRSTAEAVDALLVYLFDCTTSALSRGSPTKQRRPFASACFAPLITPLSRREQQLLGLYHRKQEQYTYVLSTQQQLLAASQLAVQALQGVSSPILAYAQRGAGASQRVAEESLAAPTRESVVFPGGQKLSVWPPLSHATVSGDGNSARAVQAASSSRAPAAGGANSCDASRAFTSALANVPYENRPRETPAAASLSVDGSSVAGTWRDSPFLHSRTDTAPVPIAMSRCAGCHEVGGDLLICTQCEEVRHEACGGPHPPEPGMAGKRVPAMNVCKRCATALNLSSSSSSLRSTTSSSERAELDEYFSSDDDASSLSGFIVNTSDDDEADGGGQSAEDDGDSNVDRAKGNEKGERRQRKHQSTGALAPPRKGQHANKNRKRRPAAGATDAASDVSSASSAASGSSSRIWSRSASLDRALAMAAKTKSKRHDSAKKVHAGDNEGDAGASAPRNEGHEGQRRKRRRVRHEDEEGGRRQHKRKRSAAEASDTSSLTSSTSSGSSSLSTKKVRLLKSQKEKASSQHQSSAQMPLSPPRQEDARRVSTCASREGTKHSPVDRRRAELLSAQPRRLAELEDEEELSALGIASSSASGTPLQPPPSSSKRRQGCSANRSGGCKRLRNVASSSSSSDDGN